MLQISPGLFHPPETVAYRGGRNVAIFSCDVDAFDFKTRNSDQVIDNVMKKLDKDTKLPTANSRPVNSVVQTIAE